MKIIRSKCVKLAHVIHKLMDKLKQLLKQLLEYFVSFYLADITKVCIGGIFSHTYREVLILHFVLLLSTLHMKLFMEYPSFKLTL